MIPPEERKVKDNVRRRPNENPSRARRICCGSNPVIDLATARELDRSDPLRCFRDRFELRAGAIYLDGNSLGALSTDARERIERVTRIEWGQGLIESWNAHDWIRAPERVGAKVAQLIGARADEVIVCDTTSVNLYKLVRTALALRPDRRIILSEPGNFPTDLYVIEGAIAAGRHSLRLAPAESLLEHIDRETALVVLTHVHYKTAATHDVQKITARAHECGALVLWDLSHSAGAVEIDLDATGADMAVGCGYKYLNGGPGAPAFMYLNRVHHSTATSPLCGWMGHSRPFDFVDHYEPAGGMRKFLCGTPSALSLAPLEASLELMIEAGIGRLATTGRRLTTLFVDLIAASPALAQLALVSPKDAGDRGSHVSYSHPHGYEIMQALIQRGVIGDFRAPDILRFGFAPLYTRFEDVWLAVRELERVLEDGEWRRPEFSQRRAVT
jgi:kynureninase